MLHLQRPALILEDEGELRDFAEAAERPWVLARRDDLQQLSRPLPLVEVAAEPFLKGSWVLLGVAATEGASSADRSSSN